MVWVQWLLRGTVPIPRPTNHSRRRLTITRPALTTKSKRGDLRDRCLRASKPNRSSRGHDRVQRGVVPDGVSNHSIRSRSDTSLGGTASALGDGPVSSYDSGWNRDRSKTMAWRVGTETAPHCADRSRTAGVWNGSEYRCSNEHCVSTDRTDTCGAPYYSVCHRPGSRWQLGGGAWTETRLQAYFPETRRSRYHWHSRAPDLGRFYIGACDPHRTGRGSFTGTHRVSLDAGLLIEMRAVCSSPQKYHQMSTS
jgi:hypothetical protein